MSSAKQPRAPDGWLERFRTVLDMDASYDEFEGWSGLHVETMRGRIRHHQLRFSDARACMMFIGASLSWKEETHSQSIIAAISKAAPRLNHSLA